MTRIPKKYLLDANIYGEMVIDTEIDKLKEFYERCRNLVLVYGIREIIRKELRSTPKDTIVGERKLRSNLLTLYDIFTRKHELSMKEEHKKLAADYYKAYREFGGSKSKNLMFNDLIIVACASSKEMDVVVSQDEKTMLTENAIKAYKFVNDINNKRTPRFIGYKDFKAELRSCLSNKFISSSNKPWIFLVFLNFFYQFAKISFFPFHIIFKSNSTINNFRSKQRKEK